MVKKEKTFTKEPVENEKKGDLVVINCAHYLHVVIISERLCSQSYEYSSTNPFKKINSDSFVNFTNYFLNLIYLNL
jgi:hypothetical protein